jgi:hypothetical protein
VSAAWLWLVRDRQLSFLTADDTGRQTPWPAQAGQSRLYWFVSQEKAWMA